MLIHTYSMVIIATHLDLTIIVSYKYTLFVFILDHCQKFNDLLLYLC